MCAADASLVVAPELSSVDGTKKRCVDRTSEKWSLEQKNREGGWQRWRWAGRGRDDLQLSLLEPEMSDMVGWR